MIKNWIVTGDKHRVFTDFKNLPEEYQNDKTGVIILGDVGFNVTLNQHDGHTKKGFVKKNKCYVYCVKGNHEERPGAVEGMKLVYDENVQGEVWMEDKYPTIRYFKEFGIYQLGNYKVLIIGGAYSVDKWYRLQMDWPWFPSEQLTAEEMKQCEAMVAAHEVKFNFVLTHTCPISWEPTDLFLRNIDQSRVDKSMEVWLEDFKSKFDWDIWCFAHYHQDRLERPYVEMFYHEAESLDDVYKRWTNYAFEGELDWWLPKSPNFYMGVDTE